MKIFLIVTCLLYVIFIADFYASLETKNRLYKVEYNGLLWVALDYYTIIKYHSQDIPMKFISFKIQNIKQC